MRQNQTTNPINIPPRIRPLPKVILQRPIDRPQFGSRVARRRATRHRRRIQVPTKLM